MVKGNYPPLLFRGIFLSIASLFVFTLVVLNFKIISDGLDAKLMGFEAEPSQGWNYWRWYFIKRSLGGILGSFGIIAVFGGVVLWGWFAWVKALRNRK